MVVVSVHLQLLCYFLTIMPCDSRLEVNQLLAVHIKALMHLIQKLVVLPIVSVIIVKFTKPIPLQRAAGEQLFLFVSISRAVLRGRFLTAARTSRLVCKLKLIKAF